MPQGDALIGLDFILSNTRMKKRFVLPALGDCFSVGTSTPHWMIVQAVDYPHQNSCSVVVFDTRRSSSIDASSAIARATVTLEGFSKWQKVTSAPVTVARSLWPSGTVIYSCSVIDYFCDAFDGKLPWNGFYKDDVLDELLFPGVPRPQTAIFKQ